MYSSAGGVYGPCEEEYSRGDRSCLSCLLVTTTRIIGLAAPIVMFGVGVDLTYHGHNMGLFYLLSSMLVFFLEITWAISLFLQVCIREESEAVVNCWLKVLSFGPAKKALLYILLGVILFLKPHRLWLSILAGILLEVLAALWLLVWYRQRIQKQVPQQPSLLHSHTPSQEDNFDNCRYEEMTEVLDDSLPTPLIADNLSELDQENMLDI